MQKDEEFRKWYDAREGTKSESFAYDVWCAAWKSAISTPREYPKPCDCVNPTGCELNDKCLKCFKTKSP